MFTQTQMMLTSGFCSTAKLKRHQDFALCPPVCFCHASGIGNATGFRSIYPPDMFALITMMKPARNQPIHPIGLLVMI